MSFAGLQGKAAKKAATSKADEFLEPLLTYFSDDDSSSSDDDSATPSSGAVVEPVKASPEQKLKAAAVNVVLGCGAALAIGSMIISPVNAVFVMGAVGIAQVPYAAYKEQRIIKIPALRSLNNMLREDAGDLEEAVDGLEAEIDELQPQVERAEDMEEELREISRRQGRNADALMDLVKENEQIILEMKDNLRQRIVQDVLRLVIKSDADRDGVFNEHETTMLAFQIKIQLGVYGVEFDEDKFRKVLRKGSSSISSAVEITKRLIPELPEENKDGDEDHDEDDYDMFHMSVMGSATSPAAERTVADSISRSIVAKPSSGGGAPSASLMVARAPGRSSKAAGVSHQDSLSDSVGELIFPPSKDAAKQRRVRLGEAAAVTRAATAVTEAAPPHRRKRDTLLKGLSGLHLGHHKEEEEEALTEATSPRHRKRHTVLKGLHLGPIKEGEEEGSLAGASVDSGAASAASRGHGRRHTVFKARESPDEAAVADPPRRKKRDTVFQAFDHLMTDTKEGLEQVKEGLHGHHSQE